MLSLDQESSSAWLKNPPFLHSNVFSSASRSRRTWRITSACRASPALLCCRPTRCRRSPTRPTSSSPRCSSPARRLGYAIPISLVITALLAVVAFSYRQTIHAYPTGGGAYIVAKENISPIAGLDRGGVAAGRLHADGRRSASPPACSPSRRRFRASTPIASSCASSFLALLTVGNLRGIKESGQHLRGPDLLLRVSASSR